MTDPILRHTAHRPWPLPAGPWVMKQSWRELLFAHWPVPAAALRELVPPALPLDLFHGDAWVGLVPFRIAGLRPRFLPPLPWLSHFPEMNLRTYVTLDGRPGVFFFSLDATRLAAVLAARALYHLPYFHAEMQLHREGDVIRYRSRRRGDSPSGTAFVRRDRPAGAVFEGQDRSPAAELEGPPPGAVFKGQYRPAGQTFNAAPGSLEHFLTERYCLYAVSGLGRVFRADVHHPPWPLRSAEARIETNTVPAAHGIVLPDRAPLLHYAERQDVLVWAPEPLDRPAV